MSLGSGRMSDAFSIFSRLADLNPLHIEVRNSLAVISLSSQDFASAREHIEVALGVEPDSILTLNQLAQLQQAQGDIPGATATFAKLLDLHPGSYAPRLAYAQLLEVSGQLDRAVLHYFRALRDARQAGRWISGESTPPGIRPAVIRANALVRQHRRELCDLALNDVVQEFGRSDMSRISGYVAIQLGEASYSPIDVRQYPSGFPFPGLPQSPYVDKRTIVGIEELESKTPEILNELQSVLKLNIGQEKVFTEEALAKKFLNSEAGETVWDGFYFYRHGSKNLDNARACPVTTAAIDRLPLCRVSKHGPEVLFSILGPGTHLLPHYGVTNVRLVGHLPLIVPRDCALSVAGEEHHWKVGEAVVFDDTYSHEAWNRSTETRVVLIFDTWHPGLTEAERSAVRRIQETLGDFNAQATALDFK